MSSEDTSLVLERALDECGRGCFTGLLHVRTLEGEGKIRFLSGIQDGVEFNEEQGDDALRHLLSANEPLFEAIQTLPPINDGAADPVPVEGGLSTTFPAARLMRYCESNSLTCALELESEGKILTARYRLGELLSIEPDSEVTARLAEAKEGHYRFKLPKFRLTDGVPQARYSEPVGAAAARTAAVAPPPAAVVAAPRRAPPPRPKAPDLAASPPAVPSDTTVSAPEAPPVAAPPVATPPLAGPPPELASPTPPSMDPVAPPAPAIAESSPSGASSSAPAEERTSLRALWSEAIEPPPQDAPLELGISLGEGTAGSSSPASPAIGQASLTPQQAPADGSALDSLTPRRRSARARYWVALLLIGGGGALAWLIVTGRVVVPPEVLSLWHELLQRSPEM